MTIEKVRDTISRITMKCLGNEMIFRIDADTLGTRLFMQVMYRTVCTKTGKEEYFRGRKWYLSQYMTEDEVIKTAYAAFEAAVKHEVMEGFKVDGIILFNPHINYEELLTVSHREISRNQIPNQ